MNSNRDEINHFGIETDLDRSWARGATRAKCFKSADKVNKRDILAEHVPFLVRKPWERKRENEEKSNTSFDDPRSFVSQNSSSQELKFIYSVRATRVYQKRGTSLKIKRKRF